MKLPDLFKSKARKKAEERERNYEAKKIEYLLERLGAMNTNLSEVRTRIKIIREDFIQKEGDQKRLLIHNFRETMGGPMTYIYDFLIELKNYEISREGIYLQSVKDSACPAKEDREKDLKEKYEKLKELSNHGATEILPLHINEILYAVDRFIICYEDAVANALFDRLAKRVVGQLPIKQV